MNLAALDAILLAMFSVPVIMQYRILPVKGTPYWLFGVLFFLMIANVLYSVTKNRDDAHFLSVKNILTGIVLTCVLGGVMWTAIADRGKIAPGQNYQVHDIVLQIEAAVRYLGDGKNPYAETYFGTPMEKWHYAEDGVDAVNPALYHFVMPPWYLVFTYPFYFISMRTLGYFDGRMPLLFAVIGIAICITRLFQSSSLSRLAVIITLLNPATIHYLIEGRSDLFALFWLMLALVFHKKGAYIFSAVFIAIAALSKQTMWFVVPLYLFYRFISVKYSLHSIKYEILTGAFVIIIVSLPFLYWNWKAFLDSVIFYVSGNTAHGYPVSGYGLGMVLVGLGIIKNIHDYYPFTVWQGLVGGFAMVWGMYWMTQKATLSRFFFAHAVSLFFVWYTSRYFNNSHIAYISTLLALGMLLDADEHKIPV